MKRFLCLIFSLAFLVVEAEDLKVENINSIMKRFFEFHVEHKDFAPKLVKRAFKTYIQQFDAEKSYLLYSEVLPFLEMNEERTKQIVKNFQQNDFTTFFLLNAVIQKAIKRAEKWRTLIADSLLKVEIVEDLSLFEKETSFAKSEKELMQRQKREIVKFLLAHQKRTNLSSIERKQKVFFLLEKRLKRFEQTYLFESLPESKRDHFITFHIVKALARSLDAHTSFFSEEEAFELRMSLEKQFEGIGVVLIETIDGVQIADLIKGSPAETSKEVQVNDFITAINNNPVENLSFEEVLELMKKSKNREIKLGLKRISADNYKLLNVTLTRQPISIDAEKLSYSFEPFGNGIIGKIVLPAFYENEEGVSSEKDLKKAIEALKAKGALKGIVLDLRENSGGFLSQAIKVAGLFITNGVIVVSKYANGETRYLRTIYGQAFYNGPLILLVSKMSASAAEIVAQSLQDFGAAIIVGDERTFGKGSIQYQTITDKEADLFFKVTIGKYYTVSGKTTQIEGVLSDIVVPTEYAPYNIGERFLEYPLQPDKIKPSYSDKLEDLIGKDKKWFEANYLPFLQKMIVYWKKMIPALKANSSYRLSHSQQFQAFLKKLEENKSEAFSFGDSKKAFSEDLQLNEAVNILKDMLLLDREAQSKRESAFSKKSLNH